MRNNCSICRSRLPLWMTLLSVAVSVAGCADTPTVDDGSFVYKTTAERKDAQSQAKSDAVTSDGGTVGTDSGSDDAARTSDTGNGGAADVESTDGSTTDINADSVAVDGGPTDSGVSQDAGSKDTGDEDTVSDVTGTKDAGTNDAATNDAATNDAATNDAATNDAGPTPCVVNQDCEPANFKKPPACAPVPTCFFGGNGVSKCIMKASPDNSPCDDSDPCTTVDKCAAQKCVGTPTCDDNKSCTTDSCDKKDGKCLHTTLASGTKCDDGDLCTESDKCTAQECVGTAVFCDDGNSCTVDSCVKKTGKCLVDVAPAKTKCDDKSVCTVGDLCQGVICKTGKSVSCDDSKACTIDSCDSKTGCKNTTNVAMGGKPCDDGKACTLDTICTADECVVATTTSTVLTVLGNGVDQVNDGVGQGAGVGQPRGIVVADDGVTYFSIVGKKFGFMRAETNGLAKLWVGGNTKPGYVDGSATQAQFDYPQGMIIVNKEILFVESSNHRVRRITTSGVTSTIAGSGPLGSDVTGYADGNSATARFSGIQSLALNPKTQAIVIADPSNGAVRVLNSKWDKVSTLVKASAQDPVVPVGVAVTKGGVVYVTEVQKQRVMRVDGGKYIFVAGGTKGFGDGTGATATFNVPLGVVVGGDGALYLMDVMNSAIRRVTPSGVVSTVAGKGFVGYQDGASDNALFKGPNFLAFDTNGRLLIADGGNFRIRRVTVVPKQTCLSP